MDKLELIKPNDFITTDAPPPSSIQNEEKNNNKNMCYHCSECSSLIEILSINENNNIIEFKCIKNHGKLIMTINDYLEKMEKYNYNNNIYEEICKIHNKKYVSYCFNCNIHLCEECLKSRIHIDHNKNNILEIKPIKEELEIIKEIIDSYKMKIETLKNEKLIHSKELEILLNQKKMKENKLIEEKIRINKQNEEKELKVNNDKYLSDIEEMKVKFQYEIKLRKEQLKKENNETIKKFKTLNEKDYNIHKFNIEEMNKKFNEEIKNKEYDSKIINFSNLKRLIEIIYNIYNTNNNNYFAAINVNNILLSYHTNEYITKNIMKYILKDKYNELTKLIFQRENKENNVILPESKENNLIHKINEDYENKIKEIKEGIEILKKKYENDINNIKNEYNKKIEKIKEECHKILKGVKAEKGRHLYKEFLKAIEEKVDEITIVYKVDKNENIIKIFGSDFVKNNQDNCKIIYNSKEYDLQEEFEIKDKNKENLEIKLKGILNITNMKSIFSGCTSLILLPDFSKWDTTNVTNMSHIFNKCTSLTSIPDISEWNTNNVTSMCGMFCRCTSIENLPDISNWNTSKVTDMCGMFRECTSLSSLPDISKWNTSKVKDMNAMFYKCSSLTVLPDISKWNINKVKDMYSMFGECNEFLNIPNKFNK